MSETIRKNIDIAIKEEVTEGTYVAPDAASDFVQALPDGTEIVHAKETLERDLLNGSLNASSPRHGMSSVSGSLNVEMKPNGTEGASPEWHLLLKSLLQGTRNFTAQTSSTGHTTSVINFASTSGFTVGDIAVVQESGAYHISPIKTVTEDTSIELEIAGSEAFSDSVVVAATQSYYSANSGGCTFSVSRYLDDAVRETAYGCRTTSLEVADFSVGSIAKLNFSYEGIDGARAVSANSYTPTYDAALPPVILRACVYVAGTAVPVSEVTLSVANTLAWKQTTCSTTGRQSSKVTAQAITGTFTPYKLSDSVDIWTKFDNETEFSLFFYAYVPTATSGEFEDSIAFWLPACKISELSEADQDGILQNSVSFIASVGEASDKTALTISLS